MDDSEHESSRTAKPSSKPVRGRLPVAGLALALAAAIALIGVTGKQLRTRQDLVGSIVAHDVPVFVPLYDTLQDRVSDKTNWNRLYHRMDQLRNGDPKQFVRTGFELEKFISTKLSPDDPRRMQVLIEVADRSKATPDAVDACWELFNPAWRAQLQPNYAKYVAEMQGRFADGASNSVASLDRLAQLLESAGESQLELQTLQRIRAESKINYLTENPMKRLAQRLPTSDPDRAKLDADLDQYRRYREQLLASGTWYTTFQAAVAKGDLAAAEKLRLTAPAGPPNVFTASADAAIAQLLIRLGRYDDGNRMRESLAQYRFNDADVEESMSIAEELTPTDKGKKPPRWAMVAAPDIVNVHLQQWRADMLAGRTAQAAEIKKTLIGNDFAVIRRFVDDETLFLSGQTAKLTPQAKLEPRDSGLPPEIAASPRAWTATIELQPIGKSIEKQPKPRVELWLTDTQLLVLFNSRTQRNADKSSKQRDGTIFSEDHIDLVFNPDRWVDTYTYVGLNDADTVYDARVTNADQLPRRRVVADKELNLDVKVTSSQTADGYQQRILLPRPLLWPAGSPAIRFNMRQLRFVTENKQRIVQTYSWHSGATGGTDFRADQFGWLLLPKP